MEYLTAYEPSWRDRLANTMLGDDPSYVRKRFVEGLLGSRGMGPTEMGVVDATPIGGLLAAQEAARGGDYRGAAMAVMPMGGVVNREAKAAARAVKNALPMDEASRLARAKQMGFHDREFYHASNEDFPSFELQPWANATGEKAHFFIDKPQVADSYLAGQYVRSDAPSAVAHGVADMGGGVSRAYAEGSQVYPTRLRGLEEFDVWNMGGAPYNPNEMASILAKAKKAKKPGVVFQNIKDPGPFMSGPMGNANVPANMVAVFDNAADRIRSKFAKFDPAKIKERDITAGITGLLGGGFYYDATRKREDEKF